MPSGAAPRNVSRFWRLLEGCRRRECRVWCGAVQSARVPDMPLLFKQDPLETGDMSLWKRPQCLECVRDGLAHM